MVRRDATWDIGRPLSPVPQAAIAKVDIPPYATPGPPPGRPRTPRCSRDASGVPGLWGRVQVVWEGLCPNGRPILSLLCLTLFLFSFSLGVLLVSLSLLSNTLCLITLVYLLIPFSFSTPSLLLLDEVCRKSVRCAVGASMGRLPSQHTCSTPRTPS